MSARAFRYDFTMKELKYYLFNKKNCPKCNHKMIRNKGYELVDGSIFNTTSIPLYYILKVEKKLNIIIIYLIVLIVERNIR